MERIPVAGPWITQREIDYAADAAANAWYNDAGEYPRRFEEAFADYIGVDHAICLPSCTSAIHLSLLALGIGPGDEVVVPDATWIASAAPINYVGATPVFADVDRRTWCLSVDAFERVITSKTKAVIPVDLYGGVPDWNGIRNLACERGIHVIEDAAEALGSEYEGRKAGSFGATGVFSFHGSKTLTTGEGGMLVTNDSSLRDRILFLRDHGRIPGDTSFQNTEVAYKYKMSALQAAVGLAQTERAEELVAKKREIFAWYREGLSGVAGVNLNAEPERTRNSYWMTTAIFAPEIGVDKASIIRQLAEKGVDSRPFFSPLSSLMAYADVPTAKAAQSENQIAYDICGRGVNLPSALTLTQAEAARVCRAAEEIVQNGGQPA